MSDNRLTKEQLKAAQALASGLSTGDVAKATGVSSRTIQRWLHLPEFQERLERDKRTYRETQVEVLSEMSVDQTVSIRQIWNRAQEVVFEILNNPDSRNCDRLKAAQIASEWVKIEELLEARRQQQEQLERRSHPGGLSEETAVEIRRQILGLPAVSDSNRN